MKDPYICIYKKQIPTLKRIFIQHIYQGYSKEHKRFTVQCNIRSLQTRIHLKF